MKKYRISIDDNIEFLRDLTVKPYKSAFDNEYLGFIRSVHERYGACFCLNLFYENYASTGFEPKKPAFCLADMTARYKADFERASDWLKFSFHSKAEYPAPPYENKSYDEVYSDGLRVNEQIKRFAGEKSLSDELTIHFGICTKDGFAALTDLGYKTFYGYLTVCDDGSLSGSYYFDRDFLQKHPEQAFADNGSTFRKTDILLNAFGNEKDVVRELNRLLGKNCDFYELMIHEQYFYPEYCNHIARYREIVEAAAATMQSAGYKGGFPSKNK